MFGHLRPAVCHRRALGPPQCGLCAHLGRHYRLRTRLLAGRDPSALLLLLDALAPEPLPRATVRCPAPPFRRRRALDPQHPAVAAAAAAQLLLADEKLVDDRLDGDHALSRLVAWLFARDLRRAQPQLEALAAGTRAQDASNRPHRSGADALATLRASLRAQRAVEADPTADLDDLARPTADGLAALVDLVASAAGLPPAVRAQLKRLSWHLGRALYLVDALVDRPRDQRAGAYNPLDAIVGPPPSPAARRFLRDLSDAWIASVAQGLAALRLHRHRAALEDTLVGSLRRAADRALSPHAPPHAPALPVTRPRRAQETP